MEKRSTEFLAPTSYQKIKAYSDNLKNYIRDNGIPLGLEKFPYSIKMDFNTKGLGRLKRDLESERVLCVLGLGEGPDGKPELKISFLGLDGDQVDPRHKTTPSGRTEPIEGEETWPPDDTITNPDHPLP